MSRSLGRRLLAEGLGTGALVLAVIGSTSAAARLSPDDVGLQLLYGSVATGLTLGALILVLQPVSGAHLNPVVTVADALLQRGRWRDVAPYVIAQLVGAVGGAVLAASWFEFNPLQRSEIVRLGWDQWLSEAVATAGLVLVVFGLVRVGRIAVIALCAPAWIVGAVWFTPSTSFANPAVTVGRTFTDNPSGIEWGSVPWFVLAQFLGALVAVALVRVLWPDDLGRAERDIDRGSTRGGAPR